MTRIQISTDASGYRLYREENGAGGHRYITDDCGLAVVLFDTSITSIELLDAALVDARKMQK